MIENFLKIPIPKRITIGAIWLASMGGYFICVKIMAMSDLPKVLKLLYAFQAICGIPIALSFVWGEAIHDLIKRILNFKNY